MPSAPVLPPYLKKNTRRKSYVSFTNHKISRYVTGYHKMLHNFRL